jgi:CheY-like chemotaxis protein
LLAFHHSVTKTLSCISTSIGSVNQKLAKKVLERAGCVVQVTDSGKEAVELYARGVFQVVLMDVQMPEMDGLTATAHIRDFEQREMRLAVPIIAMTAHAMSGDRERFLAAGMDDYVSKPFNRRKLLDMICRWAGRC